MKSKALSACVDLANENNPNLSQLGLKCIQTLIEIHTEDFQPYLNLTFDSLITKYADVKV
jgi:hypothetical protein